MIGIKRGVGDLIGAGICPRQSGFPEEAISSVTAQPGQRSGEDDQDSREREKLGQQPLAQENAVCEQLQVGENNLSQLKFPMFFLFSSLPSFKAELSFHRTWSRAVPLWNCLPIQF